MHGLVAGYNSRLSRPRRSGHLRVSQKFQNDQCTVRRALRVCTRRILDVRMHNIMLLRGRNCNREVYSTCTSLTISIVITKMDGSVEGKKRKRSVVTIETKLEVIEAIEKGKSQR